ncbi:hypothetical protein K8I85_00565, partial [bacterium]|nr:hypothetical protein [bacterium]
MPETLVIGVSAQPDYLNPLVANSAFSTRLHEILFLRLVEFGPPPDYAFSPQLAESWELSDGDRVLTYRLRRDITWHDGVPTTAHDVVFTFDMASNADVPFPEKSKIRHLRSWEAIDDWTVRFTFHEPSWEPLYDTQIFIVPKHLLEGAGTDMIGNPFARNPVGNGPFRFVEWVPEARVVLAANDAWPDGRPGFDRLVFRVISETTTLHTEFLTGGVDLYQRFPNKYYRQDADNPDLEFPRFTDRGYVYIGWNHRNPLFRDVRVRRALTMATDREAIITAFRDGFGEVACAPMFLGHPDRRTDLTPLPFDPARAAALLDEAGWTDINRDGIRVKDGVPFAFTFTLITDNEISEEIATLVEAEYGKLGIGVSLESYEWTVYLE